MSNDAEVLQLEANKFEELQNGILKAKKDIAQLRKKLKTCGDALSSQMEIMNVHGVELSSGARVEFSNKTSLVISSE